MPFLISPEWPFHEVDDFDTGWSRRLMAVGTISQIVDCLIIIIIMTNENESSFTADTCRRISRPTTGWNALRPWRTSQEKIIVNIKPFQA
jgi:hypothetical protein